MIEPEWMFLERDPISLKSIYIRTVGDKIQVKETIPMWLAEKMLEENKQRALAFDANGGWKNKNALKYGALVASIPNHIDAHLKTLSGFDPKVGGQYDKQKYNSLLDDIDYAKLRTGGGKLGKRKAFV
jgi:hypothetical protein